MGNVAGTSGLRNPVVVFLLFSFFLSLNLVFVQFLLGSSSINDFGGSFARHNKIDRVCTQNPYRYATDRSLEDISEDMTTWLDELQPKIGSEAQNSKYLKHTHERFFPFKPMASCPEENKACIGGYCGKDSSKIICGLDHLARQPSCVIYSIGSNDNWQFEEDVLSRTKCDVYTFDCTGPKSRFHVPDNPRLHFHHVCLVPYPTDSTSEKPRGMVGESWTLLQMQQRLGHDRIDLLKVDIEGWEWPLFNSWPELSHVGKSEEMLLPMQILVEVHYQTQFKALHPENGDFKTATDIVELQAHFLRMGYVTIVQDDNAKCMHCTELTLLRVRCPDTGVYSHQALQVAEIMRRDARI